MNLVLVEMKLAVLLLLLFFFFPAKKFVITHFSILIGQYTLGFRNTHLHLIQYVFDGTEHEVKVVPHGNSKKSNAARYVRTKRSVVGDLKEVSATKKPKQAFHKVDVQKGGIVNAK